MTSLDLDALDAALFRVVGSIHDKLASYGVTRWFISGGFLRDTLLGITPKDVDIFVPAADAGHVHEAATGLEFNRPLEEYIDQEVVSVASFDLPEVGIPVEVIVLGPSIPCDNVNEVMARFDTDICKVLYSPADGVVISEEFKREVLESTITICRANGASSSRSEERLSRLSAKFPGYTIQDPLGLRNLWATVEAVPYE